MQAVGQAWLCPIPALRPHFSEPQFLYLCHGLGTGAAGTLVKNWLGGVCKKLRLVFSRSCVCSGSLIPGALRKTTRTALGPCQAQSLLLWPLREGVGAGELSLAGSDLSWLEGSERLRQIGSSGPEFLLRLSGPQHLHLSLYPLPTSSLPTLHPCSATALP